METSRLRMAHHGEGASKAGWYVFEEGHEPGTTEWIKGPGTVAQGAEELRQRLGPGREATVRGIVDRGLTEHVEGACREFLEDGSPERAAALRDAAQAASDEWGSRTPETERRQKGGEEREEAVFEIDGRGNPTTPVPGSLTFEVSGGRIWVTAEKPVDVVIHRREGDGEPHATFVSDHPGHVTMNGELGGNVTRTGVGDGDAVRVGPGAGNAVRTGPGNGDAWRGGTGRGSALRNDLGNGRAVRTGTGNGHAGRSGCGRGDALSDTTGRGDAAVMQNAAGNAVRSGRGAGMARVEEEAQGHALRTGSGHGNAARLGTGSGHAWRTGDGDGDAVNRAAGHGHAVRTGDGGGGVERNANGTGRGYHRDLTGMDAESRAEIRELALSYGVTDAIRGRSAPAPAPAPPAAGSYTTVQRHTRTDAGPDR